MKKRKLWLLLQFSLCVFFLQGCEDPFTQTSRIKSVTISENEIVPEDIASESSDAPNFSKEEPLLEEEAFQEYDITLMAVGDNLLHKGVVNTGKQADGSYDFSFLFEGIAEYLQSSDIKVINQETIFGGDELGVSGFPYFNSPTQVGDAIAEAGFNVVLHASNHTADQGIQGIENCAAFWESHPEVLTVGIHKEPVSTRDIPLLTIKDVTFAILNYTYGPNLEVLPYGYEQHMNFLCNWDENTRQLDFTSLHPDVLSDIEAAKKLADIVIVFPHWGTEYTTRPSSYQEKFALQMTAAGADLIIGTHPHVVQPVEWITAENGNRALCYYSLGNYVSMQNKGICMFEALAYVTFHVTKDGVSISEANTGAIPLVCHYTYNPVRIDQIYPLEDYTEELALSHGIRNYYGVTIHLEELQQWSLEILGDWVLPAHANQ